MKYLIQFAFIVYLFVVLTGCRDKTKAQSFDQLTDGIRTHFAPDSRVDRFELRHKSGFDGLFLDGYTTVPAAYDSVMTVLEDGFVIAKNNFRLLPDAAIGNERVGIINVSVANLRSKPGHSRELATQALLGTPIRLLDFQDGWYLVRTPDRYLAWLEPGAFVRMTPLEAKTWLGDKLRMFGGNTGRLMSDPDGGTIISDLVFGNLLNYDDDDLAADKMARVRLPDGQTGYIEGANILPAMLNSRSMTTEELLAHAEGNMGRPYLWGGTSPKAMDCSGFTKTAFYESGYVIPRDASQQVHAGTEVELTADFQNLEPGDLLFFGRYRDDGSEKFTHVGFYTGNGRFLHAGADNGRIMEQSLRPDDPDFAEHRLKSLLRARRLTPGTPGVVPLGKAFTALMR